MDKFTSQQLTIHYRIEGAGQPLLFLHGFLEDHSMWNSIVKKFSTDHQCIVVDLPAHGLSRISKTAISIVDIAQLLKDFCLEKNIQQPTVVGHSLGGYIALELANLMSINPILLHSNFWEDDQQKKVDRNRVIEVVQQNSNRFIQEAIPNLFAKNNRSKCQEAINQLTTKAKEIPPQEIIAITAAMRDRKANYTLAQDTALIMIHGEEDPIISNQKLQEELAQFTSPIQLFEMKNIGHMSIWENPEGLNKLLKTAISK